MRNGTVEDVDVRWTNMVKYYKVLGEGLRTRDGFQWKPGKWNMIKKEDIDHEEDGRACGTGLHVFVDKPNWNYQRYLPDHTYEVLEVAEKLGENEEKARFRKVKIAALPMSLEELLGKNKDGFKGACLQDANLSDADLTDADLRGADLQGANLSCARLTDADLSGVNLFGANLFKADLTHANLAGANLREADLSRAYLFRADLSDCIMPYANLSSAYIRETNFTHANLRFANFFKAVLNDSDISFADVDYANMIGIDSHNVKLEGVNLGMVYGIQVIRNTSNTEYK